MKIKKNNLFIVLRNILVLYMYITSSRVFAQKINEIKGLIKDKNAKAIEFATIALLRKSDSSLVKGSIADSIGAFVIDKIDKNEYILRASYIGYNTEYISNLKIDNDSSTINIGTITLQSDAKMIEEVIVKGERAAVERSMGKIVVNASNSLFKAATDAIEILRLTPTVLINKDGEISIKGIYTPVVYIEGIQQPLTKEELRNLPVSDIDKIEIISNATAKYDGSTRAVINIKLKRNESIGWKGSTYIGGFHNRRFYSHEEGISANLKTKRWIYYGRIAYNLRNSFITDNTLRKITKGDSLTKFVNDGLLTYSSKPFSYQLSANYLLSKNHNLGIFLKGNYIKETNINQNNSTQQVSSPNLYFDSITKLNTYNFDKVERSNMAVDFNYKGTLSKKNDELSVYYDIANYTTSVEQNFRTDFTNSLNIPINKPLILRGNFPSETHIKSLRAEYILPVNKTTSIEAGTKTTWTNTDNILRYDTLSENGYVYDSNRSNQFKYLERIIAGYLQYSYEKNNNSLLIGMRIENTNTYGYSKSSDKTLDRNYTNWLPTLNLQHKIKNGNSISVNYSRKIQRPSFYDLNPFVVYLDPYSLTQGNPFLLPVIHNTIDATFSSNNASYSLNYVDDQQSITQIPVQNNLTNTIIYTRANLGSVKRYFLDISYANNLSKNWKMQHYITSGYIKTFSDYPSGGIINTGSLWFYGKGIHTINLIKKLTTVVSYEYNSPYVDNIYKTLSYFICSVGLQRNILKDKINIQLNFNDIFYTYREAFYTSYQNLDVNTYQKNSSQQASLRLTYNFGKSSFNRKVQQTGSYEEEQRAR